MYMQFANLQRNMDTIRLKIKAKYNFLGNECDQSSMNMLWRYNETHYSEQYKLIKIKMFNIK